MANESMAVITALARKGGSGKSTLIKALASAAAAGNQRTLLIDTDPQGDLSDWYRRSKERGMVPDTARMMVITEAPALRETIERTYEDNTADFIFIDTAGSAGDWADAIAIMSDVLVTPVVASESDFKVGRQTIEWFRGLHGRVAKPEALPPHRVVLTNFPSKPTKLEFGLMHTALAEFPVINHVVQRRSAYVTMDAVGFLGNVLETYESHSNALERRRATIFKEALVEAMDVLNDLLGHK